MVFFTIRRAVFWSAVIWVAVFGMTGNVRAGMSAEVLLATLQGNAKLKNADEVLADFYAGDAETGVIVYLKPSSAATALAAEAKQSAQVPEEFNRPGAPPYYNLKDESVKKALSTTVRETVDRTINSLDPTGLTVKQKFTYQFGFAARVTPAALEAILNNPNVIEVAKDHILHAHLAQGIPLMNATASRSTYSGSGLSIAICDTGIDTSHPRLGNGGSPIFNSKVIGGYDTGDNDADPRPNAVSGEAHGTACAGIAAGDTGTVGDYIGGVAYGAKLYAIKISTGDTGSATEAAMIAGWEWAVTNKNADPSNPIMIISTSFGGGQYTATCDSASGGMTTAAANAVAAGITVFASSGNDGYCNAMGWPACISYVNSVGAVYDANFGTYYPCVNAASCAPKTATGGCSTGWYATDSTSPDKVTSYSNSASFLDIFAPANQAYTTDIVGAGGYDAGDYDTSFGGTSAACPYAAGAAAVLQSAAKAQNGSFLTPTQVRQYLANYGDNVTDGKVAVTKPRVNLGNAVGAVVGGVPASTTSWPLFLPALTKKRPPASYWGALSYVYCTTSASTFSLTSGGVTKKSVCSAGGCTGGQGTFEGWTTTTPGTKSFSWSLKTATCGSWSGGFNYALADNMNYLFYMNLNGSGQPTVYVSTGSGKPSSANAAAATTKQSVALDSGSQLTDAQLLTGPQGLSASSGQIRTAKPAGQ